MTNEEFERRMEFIVNRQAQFSVDIQQLREAQAETNQIVNRLATVTVEGFKDVNAKLNALIDSHILLKESHERLREAQARTDESLKSLIAVVDRYFEGRNGRTSGETPG